jgi:hypothetical protein
VQSRAVKTSPINPVTHPEGTLIKNGTEYSCEAYIEWVLHLVHLSVKTVKNFTDIVEAIISLAKICFIHVKCEYAFLPDISLIAD